MKTSTWLNLFISTQYPVVHDSNGYKVVYIPSIVLISSLDLYYVMLSKETKEEK